MASHCPDHVAQARMVDFLRAFIGQSIDPPAETFIVLVNLYREHLLPQDSFNLEAELYPYLATETREQYAMEVTTRYGGRPGAVELLTFLCCHDIMNYGTRKAAVELLMYMLHFLPYHQEHTCLAFLFGNGEFRDVAWAERCWSSFDFWSLIECLDSSLRRVSTSNSVSTGLDDRPGLNLALARTTVMLLLPYHNRHNKEDLCIEFLFDRLCSPQSPLGDTGKLDIIRLVLEESAILTFLSRTDYYFEETFARRGIAILGTIIRHLGRLLGENRAIPHGEQLFRNLAFSEATGQNNQSITWDLGEWIRTDAPTLLDYFPSLTTVMQDFHDAMAAIYPLCSGSTELRSHWDRIGYPGRPGDTVSTTPLPAALFSHVVNQFSDPFLDVGLFFTMAAFSDRFMNFDLSAFFAIAEAPSPQTGDLFSDPSFDVGAFFETAEAPRAECAA
ncbi:hypothetical protein AURDEDRAFT_120832 [Auricularia subglabra TFB-10046 SS5]|nr:hypothetical protein AURDEDRAFT_120832 [Auricularia subglabra TFB-10046 SS5]